MEQVKRVALVLGIFWISMVISAATIWTLNKIFSVEAGEGAAVASGMLGLAIFFAILSLTDD